MSDSFSIKHLKLNIIFSIGILAISSCDKITNPIISQVTYSSLPNTPPDHVTQATDSTLTKVLLEDYMGHFCVNCANAAATAAGLQSEQVITMEVNYGYFADTAGTTGGPLLPGSGIPPGCDTAYFVNYNTSAGNAWGNIFMDGGTFASMPQGMINRIYYDANYDEDIQYSNWGTVVDSLKAASQTAAITMVDSCWLKQQIFGTQVRVELLSNPTPGAAYYLQMVVVEDSVEDWQSTPSGAQQYFVHHFTLRSAINGSWGDQVTFSGVGMPVTKYYTFTSPNFRYNNASITQPPQVPARLWNMAHCYVIAFLYQYFGPSVTPHNYYVLQAQMVHI